MTPPPLFLESMGQEDPLIIDAGTHKPLVMPAGMPMLGNSAAMRRALLLASKVAPTDSTVLITGETGTGKELLARSIHMLSPRRDNPFVAVNTGAIPENLQESELFGHSKGSFTGAVNDRRGLFEEANRGTLFLDEVGEMPLSLQVKLLRALDSREVRAVGSAEDRKIDVRVLAATHRDLTQRVQQGLFREDLYFRLNVIHIHMPPLREREEDVALLLESFLDRYRRRYHKPHLRYASDAMALLKRYAFPGNVRELDNVVQHGVVMAEGPELCVRDLPPSVVAVPRLSRPAYDLTGLGPVLDIEDFQTLEQIERRAILDALKRFGGNQTLAAKKLGISRSTFWRKMREHALDAGEEA
jgi:DNA-binding NtrC family response regulator